MQILVRIQLFTFTLMRFRFQLPFKVMGICDHWSTAPPPLGLHFEPSGLHCERPRHYFEPLKLSNFDFNEDPYPFLFILMRFRIRIQLPILMQIHADPGSGSATLVITVRGNVADLMKLGFVISVAVSFPLVIFPCRTSIHSLLFRKVPDIFFSERILCFFFHFRYNYQCTVVYMARDVVILIGQIPLEGHYKGRALKIEIFLGPEMVTSEANTIWGPKMSRFSESTPSNGPSNGFAPIKIQAAYKKQVHW